MDQRLIARLHGGLQVELMPPDREVRLAVAKRLLAGSTAGQDASLADYLAGRPADSIREVHGLVHRVLSAALAQQVEPSAALAREVLEVMTIPQGRAFRRSGAHRTSGIVSPGLGLVRSREKTVEQWPDVADRLMTELR